MFLQNLKSANYKSKYLVMLILLFHISEALKNMSVQFV